MSANLQKQIDRLRSHAPLIGGELRRLAIRSLIRDGSPEAMNALADLAAHQNGDQFEKLILKALAKRAHDGHAAARDALCRLMALHHHLEAQGIVFSAEYFPRAPELQPRFVALLCAMITDAHHTLDARHAMRLLNLMADAGSLAARDALCALVIEHQQERAREIALKKRYAPSNPYQRALFFVLTAQWEQYETFDFDRRFLRAAYKTADGDVRQRIAASTRRSGRADLLASFVTGDHLADNMEDADWAAMLDQLRRYQAWRELWRVAQIAPAQWSARLFASLDESGWQPEHPVEQRELAALLRLAAACRNHAASGWLMPCVAMLQGYVDRADCFAINDDGQIIAAGSHGSVIRIWRLPDDVSARMLQTPTRLNAMYTAYSAYRRVSSSKTLRGHDGRIACLALSSDGNVLASGSDDASVRLWHFPGGMPLSRFVGHASPVRAVALCVERHLAASGDERGQIFLWDWHAGTVQIALPPAAPGVTALLLARGGEMVVSGHADGRIALWNAATSAAQRQWIGHDGAVTRLVAGADTETFISGGADGVAHTWSLRDGAACQTFNGHAARMTAVALRQDGGLLVSGGADNTLRVWDAATGRLIKILRGHSSGVCALAISPDGRMLVSGADDNSVRLWGLGAVDFGAMRAGDIEEEEIRLLQARQREAEATEAEQAWLQFLLAQIAWLRRFDVDIGELSEYVVPGAFDIEIE